MMRWYFGIICVLLIVSGCATKSQFVYDHPVKAPKKVLGNRSASVAPVVDEREGEKKIDQIYVGDPLAGIQEVIKEELASTGLFESVEALSTADESSEADVLVEPSLMKLEWVVPDYDSILRKVFVISFLTGGIGGVVYGSTNTEVHGDTSLHIRVVDKATGKVLLEKMYDGHCQEQMVKLKCDIPETKATMVGKSLKEAMNQMKVDLREAMESEQKEAVSSLGNS